VKVAPVVQESKSSKASFGDFIALQSSEGFWTSSAKAMILNFTNGNPLPASLAAMDEKVVMTLIALCILEECFEDRQTEWLMIAQKAKNFLNMK